VSEPPDGALRVTASRLVYENRWMRLREDETLLPDGSPGLYAVVEKAPSAVILPFDGERLWLVNQYRHTVGERFWELPQGALDGRTGVEAEEIARTELAEETGLRAGALERLGRLFYAYGYSDGRFDVWLATDLTEGEQALEPTEQGLVLGRFTLAEIDAMVRDGAIGDAATVAAIGMLRLRTGVGAA
jgi:8-oxo-dGTP pyrophosphatase MutT (NUDIX family)